ncbi:MAG: hypothetical protein OEZ45_06420 [Candidatus Aminicenantes bacterium]|nr:hypothetical protein [Candidatus Aminicenantes bacterium]
MNQKKYVLILFTLFMIASQFSLAQTPSYSDEECLFCHGKPEISQILSDGRTRSLYVDPEEWSQDIHHAGKVLCVGCHTNANPYLHFREGFIDVDCARCHPEEAEEYQKNVHLTFAAPSPGKELPLCFHCHTKHHVLRHDDPSSSVHEKNIGDTCGSCHAEVMVKSIFKGSSMGKISGHRKGDLSEKFDMRVCINCHYDDSAHGVKRVFKDFCSRCHDVSSMASLVMGPTHLDSQRITWLNSIDSGLVIVLVLGVGLFIICRSRGGIANNVKSWLERMRIQEKEIEKPEAAEETAKEEPKPELTPEPTLEESGPEDQEPQPEKTEEITPEPGEEKKEIPEQEQIKEEAEEDEPAQEEIKEEDLETEKVKEDQDQGQSEECKPEEQKQGDQKDLGDNSKEGPSEAR